jgi:hypothetical protein
MSSQQERDQPQTGAPNAADQQRPGEAEPRFDRPEGGPQAGSGPGPVAERPEGDAEAPEQAQAQRGLAAAPLAGPVTAVPLEQQERVNRLGESADVLADIPHARLEQLSIELEATSVVERLKLDVTGLELGLLLKADLDNLAGMTAPRGGGGGGRPGRAEGLVGGLRRLAPALGGGERTPLPETIEGQARMPAEPPADTGADPGASARAGDRPRTSGRAAHLARRGSKGAAIAAAGAAGGALLESWLEQLRKSGVDLPELRGSRRRQESPTRRVARRLLKALPD